MKTIHNYYSNVPCLGKDCKFWGGEYQEEKVYPKGYSELTGLYTKEEFKVIWHGEHCNKNSELIPLREEIFNRADKASHEVYSNFKGKSVKGLVDKSLKVFYDIANEWETMRCPFYEIENKENKNE